MSDRRRANADDDQATTLVTRRARALSDPSRARILGHIAGTERPVAVAELTAMFRLHHNTVREHLAKLRDADLVVEACRDHDGGPGRPSLVYTATDDGRTALRGTGAYERLSHLLLDVLASGDDPAEVGRRAGEATRTADRSDGDPMTAFTLALARDGFAPRRAHDDTEIVLQNCPYATAAAHDPTTVCRLHLGLAQGLGAALGDIVVTDLQPRDPHRAGCRLLLRG